MRILEISRYFFESSATFFKDGKIIGVGQQDRFSRKMHNPHFQTQVRKLGLKKSMSNLNKINAIAFEEKPLLRFENFLQTYLGFTLNGVVSFLTAHAVSVKEKLYLKKLMNDALKNIGDMDIGRTKLFSTCIGLYRVFSFLKFMIDMIGIVLKHVAETLGWISSKIIISIIFLVFLSPLVFMYRLFKKDNLVLINPKEGSIFKVQKHIYKKRTFPSIWQL